MFNRRTLATITAVAALAGGAAGGVTSTVTTPEGANAAEPPHININPGTPPDDRLGTTPVRKTIPDSVKISRIWAGVDKLEKAQVRTDARMAALDAKVDGVNARTVDTKETIDNIARMTHGANGRTLINLIEEMRSKIQAICEETVVKEVFGIDVQEDARCF